MKKTKTVENLKRFFEFFDFFFNVLCCVGMFILLFFVLVIYMFLSSIDFGMIMV